MTQPFGPATQSPDEILRRAAARGASVPNEPWIGRQSWCDMLLAHWHVDPKDLTALLPEGLKLAERDGEGTLSVVAYSMVDVAPRGIPRPMSLTFPQLNLRTYVTYRDNPGIYFFSLDAGSRLAASIGGFLTKLPYFAAEMRHDRARDTTFFSSRRLVDPTVSLRVEYAREAKLAPDPWLLERYAFYSMGRDGQLREGVVCHEPWRTTKATATFQENALAHPFGEALQSHLVRSPETLQYAERTDVLFWRPKIVV